MIYQTDIDAHLLICMIALIMMRIIQKRIRDLGENTKEDVYWNVGMSGERIQAALNKWIYQFSSV